MKLTLDKVSGACSAIAVIAGFLWFIGKPAAEQFVQGAVADKIEQMGSAINAMTVKQEDETVAQVRTESDLASLKAMNTQSQDMLRILLDRGRLR